LTIASTSPGEDLYGPNASSFASCKLVHVDGSSFSADPQFVLELPDTIGAHYGLTDGYSIPFPTPWIYDPTNPNSQCKPCEFNCGGTSHCEPDQDPAEFEALWASDPDVSTTQYLVYTLQNNPTGRDPTEYQVGGRQFFFNGTNTYYYVAPRNDAVNSDVGQDPGVDAVGGDHHYGGYWWGNCVYVLRVGSNGLLQATGISAPVGQGHDPINWPN
jgi:hypothetical protein